MFVGANLIALVETLEADGVTAAANVTAAAEAVLVHYAERERIAREISALLGMTTRANPGDVSRSSAEALAREARRLIGTGGEEPPRLSRDRFPVVEQATVAVPA
jgi:hypothetical protein